MQTPKPYTELEECMSCGAAIGPCLNWPWHNADMSCCTIQAHTLAPAHDPAEDGPEVNIIRRETINRFADRQDNTKPENVQNLPSLAANMTHDPAGVGPITQPLRIFPTTPEDMSMSGREREVLQSFCILSRSVMERVFHYQQAADCVCPDRARHPLAGFEYSEKVFNYIREAVYMRMCKEGKI